MRFLRRSGGIVLIGAIVVVGVLFWPANLGGRTTYVSTHGTSMIPRFHAGDLAIVQPTSHYRVGEITAYHSATLHTVVLHRIIAIHNGHFTFKGDNNNFVDPDHPTVDQLVGRLIARVPHGGELRGLLARPVMLFPILALILGGFVFGAGTSRRKRASGHATRAGPSRARPHDRRLDQRAIAVLVTGALVTSGSAVVAAAIWTAPRTERSITEQPYRQTATIAYSGKAPPGAAYPDGRLHNGDPLFTRMVKAFTIDLHYRFASPATTGHTVHGTSEVVADVSSQTGWHRELVLASSRVFSGDSLDATTRLDLGAIRRMERAFSAETGLDSTEASLQINWNLHVAVSVAGSPPESTDLAPALAFQLTPVELLPSVASAAPGQAASTSSVFKTGAAPAPSVGARTFGLWSINASDSLMRLLSLLLVVASIAGTAIVLTLDRRRTTRDVVTTIMTRYRYLLVNAETVPVVGRRPVVQVDTMRDLARLAKLHEELIVHAEESGLHRFVLFTESVVYQFDAGTTGSAGTAVRTGSNNGHDHERAKWALERLEACVAERRRAPLPTPDAPRAEPVGTPRS